MTNHRLPSFMRAQHRITRRHFIGASSLLAGAGWLSSAKIPLFSRAYAQEMMEHYKSAEIDWRQAEGQSIVLGGLEHPWMNAVQPLLPQFTELTGIEISAELQSESEYTAEIPIKLGGGSAVPDVYMVFSLGQAIEAGWLEPLDQHYANADLFDAAWYEEDDIFASARSFPVWHDGERYVMAITAEAQTLFINKPLLDAAGADVPTTFDELYDTAVALKNDTTAGIAMRAKAPDGGPWPAGGFIFSHGGEIVGADGVVKIDSPEAIAAIDMYGKLLRDAGPLGVGNYHWYECLNDFMTEAVAIGLDFEQFRDRHRQSRKEPGGRQCGLWRHAERQRQAGQGEHVALACGHQQQVRTQTSRLAVSAMGDQQADLRADGGCRSRHAAQLRLAIERL